MLSSILKITRSENSEKGNAIIEFAIGIPFVITMLMGVVDLGRALNTYLTVTRIVYEGSRFAATVGALEVGDYQNSTAAVSKVGHQRIRARVNTLLERHGIPVATLQAQNPNYLRTERAGDNVTVQLTVPFQADFPLIAAVLDELGAEATGPWLFL